MILSFESYPNRARHICDSGVDPIHEIKRHNRGTIAIDKSCGRRRGYFPTTVTEPWAAITSPAASRIVTVTWKTPGERYRCEPTI